MAKKQKWTVTSDTGTHTVEYTPRTLFSRAKIKIDENTININVWELLNIFRHNNLIVVIGT